MAIFFIDGFDKYMPSTTSGNVNNSSNTYLGALMAGEWNSLAGAGLQGVFIGNPLSASGGALTWNAPSGASYVQKTLPTNYATLIGGFRFNDSLSAGNAGIQFYDSTTQQGGLVINSNGAITIEGANGATVATSSQSVSASTTHYLEWSIAFASSGAYSVYLDGTQIMSGTGNFKQSSNAYANTIRLGVFNSTSNAVISFDDLYLDDGAGSILATNPVVETHVETSDSATAQFSVGASVFGAWVNYSNATNAPGANTLFLRAFTPTVSGTLASVSTIPSATSSTAKFKAVVYADSSNKPGSLLATGNEVVGTGTAAWNNVLTSAFSSPPSLTAGTQYWIGFITDTSVALELSDNNTNGQQASNTYTSGAPGTAPTMSTGKNDWILWGNLTGVTSHTYEVTESPPLGYLGDYSYVQSSTVGQEDVFNVGALISNPSAIYAVAVKGFLRDSDAGARTVTLQTKSSSTDSSGSSFTPSTTYQWFGSYWANDPNGNVAWTVTNLNNALDGYKVNS